MEPQPPPPAPGSPSKASPRHTSGRTRAAALRLLLVDLDGTLLDLEPLRRAAWERFTAEPGLGGIPLAPYSDTDALRTARAATDASAMRLFLEGRGVVVPEGSPSEGPGRATLYGLAARWRTLFHDETLRTPAGVFRDVYALLREARMRGMHLVGLDFEPGAVRLLERNRLADLFDRVLDGDHAVLHGFLPLPVPDLIFEAAEGDPEEALLLTTRPETARAAAQAAIAFVLGLDRHADREALAGAGAHRVVRTANDVDLAECAGRPGSPPS